MVDRSESQRQRNIKRFKSILSCVQREGIDKLIQFLEQSDFFEAPASTNRHSSYKGGLLQHSLNVYDLLYEKLLGNNDTIWTRYAKENNITQDTVAIIGLLHDICKTNFYIKAEKNRKNYNEEVVKAAPKYLIKEDSKGSFIWETVDAYAIEDKIPYGHGEKSVEMINLYIKLKWIEKFSIRWHMGFSYAGNIVESNLIGDANRKYPICLATQEADQEATFMLEEEE